MEGGKVMGRQTKEEGVRLLAEVIGHAFDSTLLLFSSMQLVLEWSSIA